jgi:membrane-associated protease RseP (regulator of RpoE activity)
VVGEQQEKTVEFRVLHKGKPATVKVSIPKRLLYEIFNPDVTVGRISRLLLLKDEADDQQKLLTRRAVQYLIAGAANPKPDVEQHYRIGVNLAEADETLRSQLRLAAGEGLVVTDVLDESAAAQAGIQKNDVLIKLDGKRLTTIEAVNAQVQEIKDRKVTVVLYRGGGEVSVAVAPRLVSEPSLVHVELRDLNNLIRLHAYERTYRAALDANQHVRLESAVRLPVAEQLSTVKKQLADLQKAVEALEAALQTPPEKSPATPEEKK